MSSPWWILFLFLPATHGHLRNSTYAEGSTSLAVNVPVNKLSNGSNVSNVSNFITPRSNISLGNATGEKDAVFTGSADSGRGRAAVVFFGRSYLIGRSYNGGKATHKNQSSIYNVIDFQRSVPNYQEHIFSYLQNVGMRVDVYLSTNSFSKDQERAVLDAYKPMKYKFDENDKLRAYTIEQSIPAPRAAKESAPSDSGNVVNVPVIDGIDESSYSEAEAQDRRTKILTALEMCIQLQEQDRFVYERVIVTRFDLFFKEDFSKSSIDWRTINVVSQLEKHSLIDDNFYALPGVLLKSFYDALSRKEPHKLAPLLSRIAPIHFIKSERKRVKDLSWFKVVRLCYVGDLKMNSAGFVSNDTLVDTTNIPTCRVRQNICQPKCLESHQRILERQLTEKKKHEKKQHEKKLHEKKHYRRQEGGRENISNHA